MAFASPGRFSTKSVAHSVAPSLASKGPPNMNINDLSQEINNILAAEEVRFAHSQEDAIKRKTVVHFADSKITLPDLYGLVLKNTKVLRLLVPMINSIIQKLIDCIREETIPQ